MAKVTDLSRATINDYETGKLYNISKDTLLKFINVLDEDIICDDYCTFVLNQTENMKSILSKHTLKELSQILNVHTATVERWCNGKYQVPRKQYEKLFSLI